MKAGRILIIFLLALSALAAVKVETWPNGKPKARITESRDANGATLVKHQTFYSNGQLAREYTERNKKYDGKVREFDREGHLILTENYRNGLLEGMSTYATFGDGGITGSKHEIFEKGTITRRIEKDLTGRVIRDESFNLDGLIDYK